MISKSKKKKNRNKNKNKKKRDNDGDQEMDDYESFMNDKNYNKTVDYLDYSVTDEAFDHLMKDIMENKDDAASKIEWDENENLPNIAPILSNLNHRKLYVGALRDQQGDNDDSSDDETGNNNAMKKMFSMFFSSRTGLSDIHYFKNYQVN